MKCFNCNKGVAYGHNVSHSKRRTKRLFKPNLHEVRIMLGTNRKKVRLCTKCLRLYKKLEKVQLDIIANEEVVTSPASASQIAA